MTVDEATRALADAEAAHAAAPSSSTLAHVRAAHLARGCALVDAGRIDEAIVDLQEARCDWGSRVEAGYLLGRCLMERGDAELALVELLATREEIERRLSVMKDITYLVGRIYEGAGKKERASEEYSKIAGAPPPDGPAGSAGVLAALRPTDPPRLPLTPGSAHAQP